MTIYRFGRSGKRFPGLLGTVGSPSRPDFGSWSWRDARYGEYRNTGPGAVASPDRPQLTDAQAAELTLDAYLGGADGWRPAR